MTPQLKMAIKLLTLNHLELKDAVAQELVDNPVLEEVNDDVSRATATDVEAPAGSAPPPAEAATEVSIGAGQTQQDAGANIDWESYADSFNYLPPAAGSGRDTQFDDLPGIDQTLTRGETLEEHILWQVRMSHMNDLECQIAARLLGEMNDDGCLDAAPVATPEPAAAAPKNGTDIHADDDEALLADGPPPDAAPTSELEAEAEPVLLADGPPHAAAGARIDPVQLVATELDVPVEWVDAVRRRVMRFDPIGVLARDLRECLLVQLEVWGYDDETLVWRIVDRHMRDAERHNFGAIARDEKTTLEDVGDAMRIVEQLEPRPARNFTAQGSMPDSTYITPDVSVQKVGDDWVILLNEDGLPKLKISKFYLDQLRAAQAAREAGHKLAADPSRTYIKDKKRSAEWLIRSIYQRQRTIYRVVESILKHQRDWFDGAGPLRPLILKEVADDIEMHESTVSRVTSRKYVHTPRGVFELKYFFNSAIQTGDGTNIAAEAVRDEIKRVVAAEEPKRPLSDAQIVKILSERNIEIARRTVAKYREELGILPSNRRKKVF
ncbi:MAG: RNA polymerase sigma-54 factor [Deltaproteobacteria bacterium RBG_16_71_12]|nr:MAG: RNA polymerase sigma-54 factor [Deltaproteobacteria bacterium RBG_16_71_12]